MAIYWRTCFLLFAQHNARDSKTLPGKSIFKSLANGGESRRAILFERLFGNTVAFRGTLLQNGKKLAGGIERGSKTICDARREIGLKLYNVLFISISKSRVVYGLGRLLNIQLY